MKGVGEPPRLCGAHARDRRQRLPWGGEDPRRGAKGRSQRQDVRPVDASYARQRRVEPGQVVLTRPPADDVGGFRLERAEELEVSRGLGRREGADEDEAAAEGRDVDVGEGGLGAASAAILACTYCGLSRWNRSER